MAVFTLFLAILAGCQFYAMHKQRLTMDAQAGYMRDALAEAKKSADAAVLATNAAIDQFTLTERPWLTVNLRALSDLIYRDDEFRITCEILVKNIGKSVAANYHVEAMLCVPDGSEHKNISEVKASLINRTREPRKYSYVLFPKATGHTGFSQSHDCTKLPNLLVRPGNLWVELGQAWLRKRWSFRQVESKERWSSSEPL